MRGRRGAKNFRLDCFSTKSLAFVWVRSFAGRLLGLVERAFIRVLGPVVGGLVTVQATVFCFFVLEEMALPEQMAGVFA